MMTITFFGQEHKRIELSFEESDFSIVSQDSLSYITSSSHMLCFHTEITQPGLPYITINILVSRDEELYDFKVNSEEQEIAQIIKLAPNPRIVSLDYTPSSISDNFEIEYTNSIYPNEIISYTGTHVMDGYKYLSFNVNPFKYEPRQGLLTLNHKVLLDLSIRKCSELRTQSKGDTMRDIIKSLVINSKDVDLLYPLLGDKNSIKSHVVNNNVDYLIVTNNNLKPTFQKLAHWKCIKGVKTRIITVEEIDSIYLERAMDIKKAIRNYWLENHIKYLLLAGSIDIVPTLGCYIKYQNKYHETAPCDHYYACLDSLSAPGPINWDSNGNHLYGEVDDNIRYDPDIYVSRISVNTVTDAEIVVNRILEYEICPKTDNWADSMLMTGCYMHTDTLINGHLMSDAEARGEILFDDLRTVWANGSHFQFYDTMTDYPEGENYQISKEHLLSELGKGYSFVHMDTHGNYNNWALEEIALNSPCDTLFSSDALTFTNPRYTIIASTACHTSSIDSTLCLGEAFMKNPQGGILGYLGNSRNGWGLLSCRYLSSSENVNLKFFRHLLNEGRFNHFGESATYAKTANINNPFDYTNQYRWLLFEMNSLGDPEMTVYTKEPTNYVDDDEEELLEINYYDEQLYIDQYNFPNSVSKICIMSLEDDGETLHEIYDGVDANNVITYIPDINCSVCLTRPNRKPLIFNIFRSGFIQNQNISDDTFCINDNLQIGRDVTTQWSQGPVIIEKGNINIRSRSGVTIKNGFEIKKGATLEILPGYNNDNIIIR